MQIQKEEIRNSIIKEAKEEFFQHGYSKASLRKIVKKAGTTIGNFYNYFESKEELFSIIAEPAYRSFVGFIKNHEEADDINEVLKLDISMIRQLIAVQLKGIDESLQKSLVILIDGSKGTKYENIKGVIQGYVADHFIAHLEKSSTSLEAEYYQSFSKSAAVGFLEGFLDIIRRDCTLKEKERLITDYLLFFTLGAYALINKF